MLFRNMLPIVRSQTCCSEATAGRQEGAHEAFRSRHGASAAHSAAAANGVAPVNVAAASHSAVAAHGVAAAQEAAAVRMPVSAPLVSATTTVRAVAWLQVATTTCVLPGFRPTARRARTSAGPGTRAGPSRPRSAASPKAARTADTSLAQQVSRAALVGRMCVGHVACASYGSPLAVVVKLMMQRRFAWYVRKNHMHIPSRVLRSRIGTASVLPWYCLSTAPVL